MILTETEFEIEVNGTLTVKIYAEFRNDRIWDVFAILELDGLNVTWSPFHHHGMIRIYEIGEFTNDFRRLLDLTGDPNGIISSTMNSFLSKNKPYRI